VSALVPTHDRKLGEAFFGLFDDFHRHSRLALADPLGVGLEG
jgi:hypothetical protein